jgi:DNA-binding SARP family transcriptional activator
VEAGQLRISLLGACTATSGNVPLDLGGPRQRAVLVVLLLARGEVVPVERLTEAVWGDAPPSTAVNTLQHHVAHLRQVLGDPEAISWRNAGYALTATPDVTDVLAARRLAEQRDTGGDHQALLLRERDRLEEVRTLLAAL